MSKQRWTLEDITRKGLTIASENNTAPEKPKPTPTPMNAKEKKAQATVQIKPLSVNDAWMGRRFKSKEYKAYEKELLMRLPSLVMPKPPFKITFEFGLSSSASDWDNPIKPTQDVICKKYGLNDKNIMEGVVKKVKVAKGEEYFTVTVESVG